MTPILVLLGLLSAATLATRGGYTRFALHIAATPLLLVVGVAVAPTRLGFITPSTLDALTPALRVGAAWLAVLVGLRSVSPKATSGYLGAVGYTVVVGLTTWALLAALSVAGIALLSEVGVWKVHGLSATEQRGFAVFVGGVAATSALALAREAFGELHSDRARELVLFLYRHDEVFGALAICVVMWLWPLPVSAAPIYAVSYWPAAATLVLGALLAAAQGLLGGGAQLSESSSKVALLGLTTLCCGLAYSLQIPEAGAGYFFGAILGTTGAGQRLLAGGVGASERPVRLVVFVLVGVSLKFSWGPVLLGLALAVARVAMKGALRALTLAATRGDDVQVEQLPVCGFLGMGGTAIPFAASFALSRGGGAGSAAALTAVAVCVGATDLIALALWKRRELQLKHGSDDESSEDGTEAPALGQHELATEAGEVTT